MIDVAFILCAEVKAPGNLTLNAGSEVSIDSCNINVSLSNELNPLTPIFSPPAPDNASLSDNPCFRIYFASIRELVVLAENVVTPTTDVTTKSPRFVSLLSNILNLLPTTRP